ncbi:MAG: integrating conjugative element protein [Gammaproteobacteria bacterium]|nr:integrating conjugative element protein [Gammaproteobacteria bacterium]
MVLMMSSISSPIALAELTVIYDSGQTKPIAPLLRPLFADEELSAEELSIDPRHAADSTDQHALTASALGPAALSNLLPVRSPGLQVGDLAATQLKPDVLSRLAQGNPRPFFLIGSDQASLQWLATHRETLQSLGAAGMLVQAETEGDVRRVADIAQGLPITLASGSDLASALGVNRYPVLITRDGLRQ